MHHYNTQGIVLRVSHFGDRDKLLTVLTKERGKIRVLAKGATSLTSRRSPYLDLMHHNVFYLSGGGLPIVVDLKPVAGFNGLRNSLPHIAQLYLVGELVDRFLAEEVENPRIFDHLEEFLFELGENPRIGVYSKNLLRFELLLLRELGFSPELEVCLKCRGSLCPEGLRFSVSGGGVLCGRCAPASLDVGFPLSSTALKVMRFVLEESSQRLRALTLSPHVRDEIHLVLSNYLEWLLENRVGSLSFLDLVRVDG